MATPRRWGIAPCTLYAGASVQQTLSPQYYSPRQSPRPLPSGALPKPLNLSLTVKGRLERAAPGDFSCFVLTKLRISQYRGTVIIPDFGCYAWALRVDFIGQLRLVARIESFDEVPGFRDHLVLFENK